MTKMKYSNCFKWICCDEFDLLKRQYKIFDYSCQQFIPLNDIVVSYTERLGLDKSSPLSIIRYDTKDTSRMNIINIKTRKFWYTGEYENYITSLKRHIFTKINGDGDFFVFAHLELNLGKERRYIGINSSAEVILDKINGHSIININRLNFLVFELTTDDREKYIFNISKQDNVIKVSY